MCYQFEVKRNKIDFDFVFFVFWKKERNTLKCIVKFTKEQRERVKKKCKPIKSFHSFEQKIFPICWICEWELWKNVFLSVRCTDVPLFLFIFFFKEWFSNLNVLVELKEERQRRLITVNLILNCNFYNSKLLTTLSRNKSGSLLLYWDKCAHFNL
jgi:hypothetical protein